MSKALYEALDLDETKGIDPEEVKEINFLLERIKLAAGRYAEDHETDETKVFLRLMLQVFKGTQNLSPDEVRAALSNTGSSSSKALGTGKSGAEDTDLRDQVSRQAARIQNLEKDRMTFDNIHRMLGLTTPTDTNKPYADDYAKRFVDNVHSWMASAKSEGAQEADAAMPKNTIKKTQVKAEVDKVKAAAAKLKSSLLGNRVEGQDELNARVTELDKLVS